jgi:hypothetical protein
MHKLIIMLIKFKKKVLVSTYKTEFDSIYFGVMFGARLSKKNTNNPACRHNTQNFLEDSIFDVFHCDV